MTLGHKYFWYKNIRILFDLSCHITKISIFIKIPHFFFSFLKTRSLVLLIRYQLLFLTNISVVLRALSVQNTLKFNNYIIYFGENFFSEVGQCSYTAAKRNPFSHCFLTQNTFFCHENFHKKKLTPLQSWDKEVFFSLGFWGIFKVKL